MYHANLPELGGITTILIGSQWGKREQSQGEVARSPCLLGYTFSDSDSQMAGQEWICLQLRSAPNTAPCDA